MYCILKYIDYLQYKRYQYESLSTLRSLNSSQADSYNMTLYFNPNCILQLILDYISTEAHINVDGECYDLCNQSGDLLTLKDYKPTIDGLTIFKPRETYYVVVIKRNDAKTEIEDIIPMLNPLTEVNGTLTKKIKDKYFPAQKSARNRVQRRASMDSKRSVTHSQSSRASTSHFKSTKKQSPTV